MTGAKEASSAERSGTASPGSRVAAAICALAILFGLVRIGVGTLMIGEDRGWWSFAGEAHSSLVDTQRFLAAKNLHALIPLGATTYFGVIIAMGLMLIAGGVAYLRRRRVLGLGLLGAYLATHGGLFVNFRTVNPKIWFLVAGAILWGALFALDRAITGGRAGPASRTADPSAVRRSAARR